jgi:hypothetical protein
MQMGGVQAREYAIPLDLFDHITHDLWQLPQSVVKFAEKTRRCQKNQSILLHGRACLRDDIGQLSCESGGLLLAALTAVEVATGADSSSSPPSCLEPSLPGPEIVEAVHF